MNARLCAAALAGMSAADCRQRHYQGIVEQITEKLSSQIYRIVGKFEQFDRRVQSRANTGRAQRSAFPSS
jgi:hypothetical protein